LGKGLPKLRKLLRKRELALRLAIAAPLAILMTGCEAYERAGEINSFFDPGEPLIRPRHSQPLVKPILDTIDPKIEEPNEQYANATDILPEDLLPVQGDYRVGKNDLISVSIYDLLGEGTGETTKNVRVSESGYIALDFIKPVRAMGMTEQQLQDAIRNAYADAGQIRNARVTVTVAEQQARTYSIYGNTAGVGRYQILENNFRLLDALILAKGVANNQGVDVCYVVRKPETPEVETPPPSDQSAPSSMPGDVGPAPAPTTQLLQPPQSRANWSATPPTLFADGDPVGTSQPAPSPIAPDNSAPSGVVEGKPVATSSPAPDAGAANATSPAASQPAVAGGATPPAAPDAGAATQTATATQPGGTPGGLQGFQFNSPSPDLERTIRIPLKELLNGRMEYNIVIHPGDVIYIPDPVTGEFYMAGHIQRSGPYSLTARKITLKQAVISAGMFDQAAIPGRSEIIRRIGDNKELYVRIDLFKVFSGEQPDIYLKPNDQVIVGTNAWAPFLAAIRNGFRISYGFGFSYDQNYSPQGNQNNNGN
jgi:protein involved in polysaccharide export with SLBB domain